MENCSKFKYISVDTEGYAPNILGLSIAHPALDSMYFPLGHREDVNCDKEVRQRISEVLKLVPYRVMHNAGHDIVALPDIAELPFVCTMIMGHMVDENLMSKGLDYMHKHFCGGEDAGKQMHPLMKSIIDNHKDEKGRPGWELVPYSLLYGYATVDAKITMELFLELLPRYQEQFGPLWTLSSDS